MKKYVFLTAIVGLLLQSFCSSNVQAQFAEGLHTTGDRGVAFVGGDIREKSKYSYLGTVFALDHPLGGHGWIGRAVVGYGQFDYSSTGVPGGKVDGSVTNFDVGVGYEFTVDKKHHASLHVGPDYQRIDSDPVDVKNKSRGSTYGVRFGAEALTDPEAMFGLELDASVSTANRTYYGRGRVGYKINMIHVGPEINFLGSKSYREQRYGAFLSANFDRWSLGINTGYSTSKGRTATKRIKSAYIGLTVGLVY